MRQRAIRMITRNITYIGCDLHRDHLGNVREVVSETGEVKQVNAYYPFGTPIHALGTKESQQRYKYNGKEFDELHGLNTYDYGARQYAPLLPLWDRVDPLAEKYYGVSPYAYCLGNPVVQVDYEGTIVIPVLYTNGIDQPIYYRSPKNFAEGMRMFARTNFGRKILADFTPKGSTIFGVEGNGKYADIKLYIQEEQFTDEAARTRRYYNRQKMAYVHGQTQLEEGKDGKVQFRIFFDLGYPLDELIETITHEFTIHLSNYEEIINIYRERNSYQDAEDAWWKPSRRKMHHDIIDKRKRKKLPGTINYEKTRDELIKFRPGLKKVFEDVKGDYEKIY